MDNPEPIVKGTPEHPCVIWSGEHYAYWRVNACGYSTEIAGAGVYTRKEAERLTVHCDPEKKISIRPVRIVTVHIPELLRV